MVHNYDYYRIFYYVAANRSMAAAVSWLGISTSTASRAIKALETELGKPLFVREKYGVSLTREGEDLYARILPAMQDLIACEEQIRTGNLIPNTSVTISVEPGILEDILIPCCLPKFYERYPHTRVRNVDLSGNEIEKKLLSGEIDFACAWIFELLTNRCEVTPLVQTMDVPIVGKKYASLANKEITLEELSKLPLILLPENYRVYVQYSKLFSSCGLTLQPALTVANVRQQILAVKAGLGYSFVPFLSASSESGIYPLKLKESPPSAFMDFFLTVKDRQLSAPAKYLYELLQNAVSDVMAKQELFFNQ